MSSPEDQKSFGRVAEAYDLLVDEPKRWAYEGPTLAKWLDTAGDRRRRVLDLGCGNGFHARHLAGELNAIAVGADPAEEMLHVARARIHGEKVIWVAATAQEPPEGPFDLILLLGNTLSLIADPAGVFCGAARVAVPGAMLVVHTLDYDALRDRGPQYARREGKGVSIEKYLTPQEKDETFAARLRLVTSDETGRVLDEFSANLADHPLEMVVSLADNCGWTLQDQLRSYRDKEVGNDRILVFSRPRNLAAADNRV